MLYFILVQVFVLKQHSLPNQKCLPLPFSCHAFYRIEIIINETLFISDVEGTTAFRPVKEKKNL